jgi:AP-1 complex subunit beta-1
MIDYLKLLQDSQDSNPLIRALAVRTMGCIRVDKITEYLCDPLQRCLKVLLLEHL